MSCPQAAAREIIRFRCPDDATRGPFFRELDLLMTREARPPQSLRIPRGSFLIPRNSEGFLWIRSDSVRLLGLPLASPEFFAGL